MDVIYQSNLNNQIYFFIDLIFQVKPLSIEKNEHYFWAPGWIIKVQCQIKEHSFKNGHVNRELERLETSSK